MRTHTRSVRFVLVMMTLAALGPLVSSCTRKETAPTGAKAEIGEAKKESAGHGETLPETVTLTPSAIQEASIKTWTVAPVPLGNGLTLNGSVGYDENHLLVVAPRVAR